MQVSDHFEAPDIPDSKIGKDMLRQLFSAVREINYGSIEIVIHDSKVVQIERREKIRAPGGGSP